MVRHYRVADMKKLLDEACSFSDLHKSEAADAHAVTPAKYLTAAANPSPTPAREI